MRFGTRWSSRPRVGAVALLAAAFGGVLLPVLAAGCGSPSKANIELRKQIDSLQAQITALKAQHEQDAQTIASLQKQHDHVEATLPYAELEKLNLPIALKLGRLTGGSDFDAQKPFDAGVKIYVVPTDKQGDPVKAAGSFVVDAFDLARQGDQHIGHWPFDLQQTHDSWFGGTLLYTYVLSCPWQTPPTHARLTLTVSFTDALTHQTLPVQQTVVTVRPPPATQPSSTRAVTSVSR